MRTESPCHELGISDPGNKTGQKRNWTLRGSILGSWHSRYLGGVTVGSPRGLAHGEAHVLHGALGDGDAVDQLLRGGVHGVYPAHHVLQVHGEDLCTTDCYLVSRSNELISKKLTSFLNCQLCFWSGPWREGVWQPSGYPVPSFATKKYLKSLARVLTPLPPRTGHQHQIESTKSQKHEWENLQRDIIDLSATRAMGCLEFLLSSINTMTNEAWNKKSLIPELVAISWVGDKLAKSLSLLRGLSWH